MTSAADEQGPPSTTGAPERASLLSRLPPGVLPAILFVLTCASTTLVSGWACSVTLMSILVAHEMGHYVVARYHGVKASLPHFIPLPLGLGTLGAVIGMETDKARRNALMDIGAAGPIAGFIVAVPAMIIGIQLSTVVENSSFEGPLIGYLGDSLLSWMLNGLFAPPIPAGSDLMASPVLMGAWGGFVVTSINLLPMGQLDGGHVAYAYSPERAPTWARRTHRALVVLGLAGLAIHLPGLLFAFGAGGLLPPGTFDAVRPLLPWASFAFLIWAMLGKLTGLTHPPVVDPGEPLTRGRKLTAALCVMILALTFMPSPQWVDVVPKKASNPRAVPAESAAPAQPSTNP